MYKFLLELLPDEDPDVVGYMEIRFTSFNKKIVVFVYIIYMWLTVCSEPVNALKIYAYVSL